MEENKPKRIKFTYNKSSNYRTYNADGVIGGLTAKGKIFFDFFNEKRPVPEFVVNELTKEGSLGKEIERKAIDGVIREIECGVFLDIETAVIISEWLNKRIQDYKEKIEGK